MRFEKNETKWEMSGMNEIEGKPLLMLKEGTFP